MLLLQKWEYVPQEMILTDLPPWDYFCERDKSSLCLLYQKIPIIRPTGWIKGKGVEHSRFLRWRKSANSGASPFPDFTETDELFFHFTTSHSSLTASLNQSFNFQVTRDDSCLLSTAAVLQLRNVSGREFRSNLHRVSRRSAANSPASAVFCHAKKRRNQCSFFGLQFCHPLQIKKLLQWKRWGSSSSSSSATPARAYFGTSAERVVCETGNKARWWGGAA